MTNAGATATAVTSEATPSLVDVFVLRCEARALLFREGEIALHEAVDVLQDAAVAYGLVAAKGQDWVQSVMAEAFAAVRGDDLPQHRHRDAAAPIPPAAEEEEAPTPLVTECAACGCSPCASPAFCAACIKADRTAARRRKPDQNLPPKWDTMSVEALASHLNDPRRHPLPKSIIDTFHYLIDQRDGDRLRTWLLQRTPEGRCALKKLLDEK